jgi:putative transposase
MWCAAGAAWRLLPHDLPPWRLCYYYFAKWRENRLWVQINDHLREAVREKRAKKCPRRCDLRRAEC